MTDMKRNLGFTLLEPLLILAIIAVLAVIVLPMFARAKEGAKQADCLANLKQFGTAFNMYLGDYDQTYPYTSFPSSNPGLNAGSDVAKLSDQPSDTPPYNLRQESWVEKLNPYVKYSLILTSDGIGRPQGIMKCRNSSRVWSITPYGAGDPDRASYGYNFLYLGLPFKPFLAHKDADWNRYANNPYLPHDNGGFRSGAAKHQSIAYPSETLLLVENATIWAFPPYAADGSFWRNGNVCVRPRHLGKSDVLYCDGHVTSMATKNLVASGRYYGNAGSVEKGVAKNNKLWDTR